MLKDDSATGVPNIASFKLTRVTPFTKSTPNIITAAASAKSVKQSNSHSQLSAIPGRPQAESLLDVDEMDNHSQLAGAKWPRKPGKKEIQIETSYTPMTNYRAGEQQSQHNTSVAEISQYQEEGIPGCN